MHVADITVALNAGYLVKMVGVARHCYRLDHLLMTITAGLLGHLSVPLGDPYRLVKSADRKIVGVPKSVGSFRVILANQIMRRVAVVAGCSRVMASLLPGIILFAHDVTVSAR